MNNWLEVVSVFLLSSVKFVFGSVILALGLKFSFFKAVIVTSLGGFTGVMTFVVLSEKLLVFIDKRRILRKTKNPNLPMKKKFTGTNKIIVIVKRRFGLFGFALMIPFFIPIPLGCFLAIRYFNDKKTIIGYLFASILFWSIAVSSIQLLFKCF